MLNTQHSAPGLPPSRPRRRNDLDLASDRDPSLSIDQRLYRRIVWMTALKGYCWPSGDYLADRLDCCRNTIRAALKRLEGHGLVRLEQVNRRRRLIHIVPDADPSRLASKKTGRSSPDSSPRLASKDPNSPNCSSGAPASHLRTNSNPTTENSELSVLNAVAAMEGQLREMKAQIDRLQAQLEKRSVVGFESRKAKANGRKVNTRGHYADPGLAPHYLPPDNDYDWEQWWGYHRLLEHDLRVLGVDTDQETVWEYMRVHGAKAVYEAVEFMLMDTERRRKLNERKVRNPGGYLRDAVRFRWKPRPWPRP